MQQLTTQVLVVGGGTGGTAAAIQAARAGVEIILVSEFNWLGGMLTAAGVAAPDGNELEAWQTGLWGAFIKEVQKRQPVDQAWVSFFTYSPVVGAQIFAEWVQALPNLRWISGYIPQSVNRVGNRIVGVEFAPADRYQLPQPQNQLPPLNIQAQITIDGTELGDLLALGDIPHRWGWDWRESWSEPSAPPIPNQITATYPVQTPTWVVMLQDYGENKTAPAIASSPLWDEAKFRGAWAGYAPDYFLNYGRLPGNQFMLNWPQNGNDYGVNLNRLIASPAAREEFFRESLWHSQDFAHYIQLHLGQRYGLARDVFPLDQPTLGGCEFALYPYFRESRRLIGITTVTEFGILPQGQVAPLPVNEQGQITSIAVGNYPNDHHYPGFEFKLAPKSIRWGGRWTGTPFTIPLGALIPAGIDGFLCCDKNISVSHIANGATRLQPLVLNIGQAAGMAAALAIKIKTSLAELKIEQLQWALLKDPQAPAAIIPFYNLPPDHPEWFIAQLNVLRQADPYPTSGYAPLQPPFLNPDLSQIPIFTGHMTQAENQTYQLTLESGQAWSLVTLNSEMDQQLKTLHLGQKVTVFGQSNLSGNWIRVIALET
ncbi:FAD-dependent oxidoreductase [Synechococcus sp. PCC 6312]|uniref:FAD-dependent oxidoreductase n=1 Tax=Synechococcus sp. (strain ATCC 27167 / PCC 6312) TaxID=195253 RepID=UPI00029F07E4|nr:FAD-dependent oxidoreductase [Synechococcus sp. PCC 6312]AFY59558.1 succinate dehydrogenase/fumarate reductase flavoprotein subunit [Synechococcus sp. PCC 6312]